MIEAIVTLEHLTHGGIRDVISQDRIYSLVLVATIANSSLFWQSWMRVKQEPN